MTHDGQGERRVNIGRIVSRGLVVRPRFIARTLAAVALATALLVATMPARTDATGRKVLPGCGTPGAAKPVVPSALPVRADDAAPAPVVTAKSAVAIDAETGRVLYDLNAHQRRAPASTTKIMTAILALENVDEDAWVVSDTDARMMVGSSVMGLRPGVYIKMRDLLYGLMLPSGNDAAVEIAKNVDGTVPKFVDRMNAKAEELGLRDTHFRNPHGLDARDHYSSAFDLAMLGRYGMGNAEFRTIVGSSYYHLEPPSDYDLVNGNTLLTSYPGAEGIKIGWTDRAGWTLVASAVRDGRRVIVAVLDSEDRDADAAALLDWAYGTYSWNEISPRTVRMLQLAQRMGGAEALTRSLTVCG